MKSLPKRSLHVGSAMIDIICIVAAGNIERMTFSNEGKSFLMVESGRKVAAESITNHVGGGACNTAVGLARRGWQAAVLAKTGDDLNAGAVREHLAANGVATGRLIAAAGLATGTAVMVASHDRNASIFVHRGANETMELCDLPQETFAEMDLVYVTSLSNKSVDCFPYIISAARSAGAMVAANPGIRQLTGRTSDFLGALGHLDLLSLNRVEAQVLVPAFSARTSASDPRLPEDAPPLFKRGLSLGGFEMDLITFVRAVQSAGPRWVSITDGTDGAYLGTPDGVLWHSAISVKVAGTAGAGDAYCSTLTAALFEGTLPETAMREAAINAASVVHYVDTTTGLLRTEQFAMRLDALRKVPSAALIG